jgi:hypothetical protein
MTDQELALQEKLHNHIAALAHRHASVSYLLIGVLFLVLALCGVGGYVAVKLADERIAHAEKTDQAFEAKKNDTDVQLKTSAHERDQMRAKQTLLEAQLAARDKKAAADAAKALDPKADMATIQTGVSGAYINDALFKRPLPIFNGMFQVTGQQIQRFTATKIERDQYAGDVVTLRSDLDLANGRTDSCQKDLTKEKGTTAACEKVKKEWKGAAKASKFKRFLGGAEKVGLFVAGLAVAHALKI